MMKFSDLFTNFMIVGLVIIGILAFSFVFQDQNNAPNKLIENNLINSTYNNLYSNLNEYGSTAQSTKTLFESENPTSGFGTILLFSIVSAGKVFNGMIVSVFNVIISLPVKLLGLDPVIVSVLAAILIIVIIVGLWSVYKLGG